MLEYHGHGWIAILTDETLEVRKPNKDGTVQWGTYKVHSYGAAFNVVTAADYDFNKLVDEIERALARGILIADSEAQLKKV